MYDQNDRTRTVFSLSIPGVIGGVFLTIIGCYVFGIGVSISADQQAGRPIPLDPIIPLVLGIIFIFSAVLFTTGIVSYFGATVIRPRLIQTESGGFDPEEFRTLDAPEEDPQEKGEEDEYDELDRYEDVENE